METSDAESLASTFREFAYVVSHDLGTPLRAMIEFSRLLKAEQVEGLSSESQLYLSMIIENGEKAQAMLAGLLEYSRLNTRARPPLPTDCNLLLQQCKEELAEKMAAKSATLTFGPLPVLDVDGEQMKRLFLCLLENALTFHQPGSRPAISVSAKKGAGGWMFAVRDNGIGISAKNHDRIFLPFKRLHADHEYPGVGMGLTLARKVVDRHGGRIWVDSVLSEGSTFMFSIPQAQAA